jgi:hypothetical protein
MFGSAKRPSFPHEERPILCQFYSSRKNKRLLGNIQPVQAVYRVNAIDHKPRFSGNWRRKDAEKERSDSSQPQ